MVHLLMLFISTFERKTPKEQVQKIKGVIVVIANQLYKHTFVFKDVEKISLSSAMEMSDKVKTLFFSLSIIVAQLV
jgi:hypothetical protein